MKLIVNILMLGTLAFNSELIVKKDSVVISVNGKNIELNINDKLELPHGSSVCFLDGDGRVVINNKKQLTKNSKQCYTVPVPEGFKIEQYISNLADKAKVALITGELSVKDGVSTRSTLISTTAQGKYKIQPNQQEVVIFSDSYGPLPVTLNIINNHNKIIHTYKNEDSSSSLFVIPVELVENNYKIQVTNFFDDLLLDYEIEKNIIK